MAGKARFSFGYALFVLAMLLLLAVGVWLVAYGSANNGPVLHSTPMIARELQHG